MKVPGGIGEMIDETAQEVASEEVREEGGNLLVRVREGQKESEEFGEEEKAVEFSLFGCGGREERFW